MKNVKTKHSKVTNKILGQEKSPKITEKILHTASKVCDILTKEILIPSKISKKTLKQFFRMTKAQKKSFSRNTREIEGF